MLFSKLYKLFNTEQYYLNKAQRLLCRINQLEDTVIAMSQQEMLQKLDNVRKLINNRTYITNDNLYEETVCTVFAIIREGSRRVRNEYPFDSQIIAALCLNECVIIEMKTGQGKTLCTVIAAIYRSLCVKSGNVHVVTVNDYLADRDYNDMLPLYNYFGITVGCVVKGVPEAQKAISYSRDVNYISDNELGFDYLRAKTKYIVNEVFLPESGLQHVFADEADLLLIDKARTPIVLGKSVSSNFLNYYYIASSIVYSMSESDVVVDLKEKDVYIKEESLSIVESLVERYASIPVNKVYSISNINIWFYIDRLLRARFLFHKNYDYIVANFKILLVDEYTGRVATDRKYSHGMQQAIEAKENLPLSSESKQVNDITVQNLYRKYAYLSGMTGTAYTERQEFKIVFSKHVVRIPKEEYENVVVHRPLFYKNKEYKYEAIANIISKRNKESQPILVGTSNIQESEELSIYLQKYGIIHRVLNAKKLSQEAEIISDAGTPGMVTIATNIAGRGTDIKLGGNINNYYKNLLSSKGYVESDLTENQIITLKKQCYDAFTANREKAMKSGGLLMIISQKQENRRIDNQFKGRTGRRSDKGEVMFFVSINDMLFKYNNNDKKVLLMFFEQTAGIFSRILESLVTRIQCNIEKAMFESRISTLNQDHVLGKNRDTFFKIRDQVLTNKIDFRASVIEILDYIDVVIKGDSKSFENSFKEIISLAKPDKVNFVISFKFMKELIINKFTEEFVMQHYEEIKMKFLIELDNLWQEFINLKDVYRRLSNFRNKVDYILDYNKQMCDLFDKVFSKYELHLINIVYNLILQNNLVSCVT